MENRKIAKSPDKLINPLTLVATVIFVGSTTASSLGGCGTARSAPIRRLESGSGWFPKEAMYLILNLGISPNFGDIDFDGLEEMWPVHTLIDYVRVYQHPDRKNIGCDPVDMPTARYIQDNLVAYT